MSLSLNQFLLLYLWFPLAALLIFLLLIARFYEKFSGEKTYFRLLIIPLVLFGAWAVRYASVDEFAGDAWGDTMIGISGIVLIFFSIRLYRLMIVKSGKR